MRVGGRGQHDVGADVAVPGREPMVHRSAGSTTWASRSTMGGIFAISSSTTGRSEIWVTSRTSLWRTTKYTISGRWLQCRVVDRIGPRPVPYSLRQHSLQQRPPATGARPRAGARCPTRTRPAHPTVTGWARPTSAWSDGLHRHLHRRPAPPAQRHDAGDVLRRPLRRRPRQPHRRARRLRDHRHRRRVHPRRGPGRRRRRTAGPTWPGSSTWTTCPSTPSATRPSRSCPPSTASARAAA